MPRPTHSLTPTNEELQSLFRQPPRDFSPVPIWWWSGEKLEIDRLRWQLDRFAEGGVYNLIVLNLAPTGPLYGSDMDDPPFLSEAWWKLFEQVCEHAGTLGVRMWFYDQIGFSGANLQGELVRGDPTLAGRWLESVSAEGEGVLQVACPAEGQPLAASVMPLDGSGTPQSVAIAGNQARAEVNGRYRLRLVYSVPRSFDYFNPAGCHRLMSKVHLEFERRLGDYFGKVLVGSFQDELPAMPTWGATFADEFLRRRGYDLRARLVELWDGTGPESEKLRIDYHSLRAELAEEAFFKPFHLWHEKHNLLCGFDQVGPVRSGHPIGSVKVYADYLKTHQWYTIPGSDHHGEAKVHSSLAHMHGHERVWIEAFHSSGWGGTLEETFDWLVPWLRAGCTLYDPHAVYYSTRGGWWEWAPPSTCWRQPYWRHYKKFADATARLCYLLSRGHHVCDVAVLFPSTTVQANLDPEGNPTPAAQAAHEAYVALVGTMFWQHSETGVLDSDPRDFDVMDEPSLLRATIDGDALAIREERFRVIVLPSCATLLKGSAEKLCNFAKAGGRVVVVGAMPAELTGQRGIIAVDKPADVPAALDDLPRTVEAPLPILHRRIGQRDVVFVPRAFPYATNHIIKKWGDVHYEFDPASYKQAVRIRLRGRSDAPTLWDFFTGTQRRLAATMTADGVEVELPADVGPAALLIWDDAEPADLLPAATKLLAEIHGPWNARLEQTLENRFGDLALPAKPGAPDVQTWWFAHRIEQGDEGVKSQWHRPDLKADGWMPAQATYGIGGWQFGPVDAAKLPPPATALPTHWKPAIYSASRGIPLDHVYRWTLGVKGHVAEEFIDFGDAKPGQAARFVSLLCSEEDRDVQLAVGAPADRTVWLNGKEIHSPTATGYLTFYPAHLQRGENLLEIELRAGEEQRLRMYYAVVRRPERFARPEWLQPADEPRKNSSLRFSREIELAADPGAAQILIAADVPIRLVVNGVEAGRQGGFDPYYTVRSQPFTVANLRAGRNSIVVEAQDPGRAMAVLVDGEMSVDGTMTTVVSDSRWTVSRDEAASTPAKLKRRQPWMDPAAVHLRHRPHPLPGAMWIEKTPADDTVENIQISALSAGRVEWFRWRLPPGATAMSLPISGDAQLWIDGWPVAIEGNRAPLPNPDHAVRVAALRVQPRDGANAGSIFTAPVTYTIGDGKIELGDWVKLGLDSYSGGVRYIREVHVPKATGLVVLDLGKVRGTAEVWINGEPAGVRIWTPYQFDITAQVQPGINRIEVLVLGTLGAYLRAVSPTPYVPPGQQATGLFGPVRVLGE